MQLTEFDRLNELCLQGGETLEEILDSLQAFILFLISLIKVQPLKTRDQEGQGVVEFALVLVLVAVIVIGFVVVSNPGLRLGNGNQGIDASINPPALVSSNTGVKIETAPTAGAITIDVPAPPPNQPGATPTPNCGFGEHGNKNISERQIQDVEEVYEKLSRPEIKQALANKTTDQIIDVILSGTIGLDLDFLSKLFYVYQILFPEAGCWNTPEGKEKMFGELTKILKDTGLSRTLGMQSVMPFQSPGDLEDWLRQNRPDAYQEFINSQN